MKVLKKVIIFTVLAVLIVSYYVYLNSKSAADVAPATDDSTVGQLLAVDMELNYPANPRAVVEYYSKITKAFYDGEYTDDQLIGLAQHARAMFDDELLEYNDYDEYMERLKVEIESYELAERVITEYIVERASDVEFIIDSGIQYAKVDVVYYTKEGSSQRDRVYEQYTLRQDEDGKWKIVYWEVVPEHTVKGE